MPKDHKNTETPRDYFYRVLKAKQNQDFWANNIPIDLNVLWADPRKTRFNQKNRTSKKEKT